MIAAKIKQGVSVDKILDDIMDNIKGETLQRHHLLDKKDIQNIQHAYGISDIQRHTNYQDSVLDWIREWQEKGEESPVLYCKWQGEEAKDEYPLLKEDFIIVILFHRMMLAKFGKNGVCIDGTRGTKACDFTLNTIMVTDEFGSGFPVIFAHEIVAYIKDLCKSCF